MRQNMDYTTKRSIVWRHFKKDENLNSATCNYCKKSVKTTSGNTSGLILHFLRHHKDSLSNHGPKNIVKRTSKDSDWASIWKYYEKNDARQTAVCKKCHKEFGINKATLKRHYLTCCNALELDVQKIDVWSHFLETDDSNQVVCEYCDEICESNESFLKIHLLKFHKKVLVNQTSVKNLGNTEDPLKPDKDWYSDGNTEECQSVIQTETLNNDGGENPITLNVDTCMLLETSFDGNNVIPESNPDNLVTEQRAPFRAGRSFVWDYFNRVVQRKTAVCVFCQKECKSSGNTTNLIQHLVRRHRSLLSNVHQKYLNYRKKPGRTDVSHLDFMTLAPKSTCRSFVWLHFHKTNVHHVAVCKYCSKAIKTSGSTSGLRYHLMKYHKDKLSKDGNKVSSDGDMVLDDNLLKGITYDGHSIEINMDQDEQMGQLAVSTGTCSEDVFQKKPNERYRSFVWKHFKKTDLPDKAICNYCLKYCNTTSGNTTGLKFHLLKHHREEMDDDVDIVTNNMRGARSLVWEHFEKTDHPSRFICMYCSNVFLSNGNTSNLRKHLIKKHAGEFEKMANEEHEQIIKCEVVPSAEYPQEEVPVEVEMRTEKALPKSPKSFVWKHFERRDESQKAACKYCQKPISTCGNTTNLRSHFNCCPKRKLFHVNDTFLEGNTDKNVETVESENEESEVQGSQPNEYDKALIWKHFVKNEHGSTATCVYCDTEFYGNTSILRKHLIRSHRALITDLPEEPVKNKPKSLVWNHFDKGKNPAKVLCNYCGKFLNYIGNTTNLWKHLTVKHAEMIETDRPDQTRNTETKKNREVVLFVDREGKKRRWSPIWNHFNKEESAKRATCVHCNRSLTTFGNTSNLWSHMERTHKNLLVKGSLDQENLPAAEEIYLQSAKEEASDYVDNVICTPNVEFGDSVLANDISETHTDALVWDHYLSYNLEGVDKAICIYCKEELDACNVTELWAHLIDNHMERVRSLTRKESSDLRSDIEAILLIENGADDKVRSLRKRRSRVWDHFDKSSLPQTAVCVYCQEDCYTYGNTTSLWNHLMKNHGDVIGMFLKGEEEAGEEEEEATRGEEEEEATKGEEEEEATREEEEEEATREEEEEEATREEEEEEAREEVDENEMAPFQMNTKEQQRSSIWRHFNKEKLVHRVTCIHCDDTFSAFSTISNLWRHLERCHREIFPEKAREEEKKKGEGEMELSKRGEISKKRQGRVWNQTRKVEEDEAREEEEEEERAREEGEEEARIEEEEETRKEDEEMEPFHSITEKQSVSKQRSNTIWKHFKKNEVQQKVICDYCGTKFSSLSTLSNLWRHFNRFHRESIREDMGLLGDETAPSGSNNLYCVKSSRMFQNVDLKMHLSKYHKSEMDPDSAEFSSGVFEVYPSDEDMGAKEAYRGSVWSYFQKIVTPQFAVCNYCQMWFEMSDNSTSLKDHLVRYHKEEIKNEQRITAKKLEPDDWRDKENTGIEDNEVNDTNDENSDCINKYFEKSLLSSFATCIKCKKLYRNDPVSLQTHLESCQKVEKEEIPEKSHQVNDSTQNGFKMVTDDISQNATPSKHHSTVWNHFQRLKNLRAACQYCGTIMKTHGNTTCLWNHVIRFHRRMIDDEHLEALEKTSSKRSESEACFDERLASTDSVDNQKAPLTSFVWRHFKKSANSKDVLCKHCNKWFKTQGGTSNLSRHLMRRHREEIDRESEKEEEEEDRLERVEADEAVAEFLVEDNYISEEDLKKAKESAGAEGLDDYVILVVH